MAALSSDQAFWASEGTIFDFTLKFEDVVLSISLSSAFIALSVFSLVYFHLQPVYIRRNSVLFIKLASTIYSNIISGPELIHLVNQSIAIALIGVRAALLACAVSFTRYAITTSAPAVVIDLLAALFIAIWLDLEHGHTLRSSFLLTIYLFGATLADITKSRSFFLRHNLAVPAGLETAAAILQLGLLCLQELSKRADIIDTNLRDNLGEEAVSGPVSRLLFLFLRPIFRTGFRSDISMNDLGQLDPEFSPRLLFQQLKARWRPRHSHKPTRSRELAKSCLRAWKGYLLPLIVSRLALTGLNFAKPFLLRQLMAMVAGQSGGPHDFAKRCGLIGASIFLYCGAPVVRTDFGHRMNQYTTRARGGLISMLFYKVHRVTQSEAKQAAAPSLMNADIDGVANGIPKCFDVIFGAIELGLGIYVLSQFIEIAALAIFGPVVVTSILTYFMGQKMATRFADWNRSIEERIAKTSHILPQLTAIKMLGLGPTVGAYLQRLRVDEVNVSGSFRRFEAISVMPVLLADMMTPVVVIAAALFGKSFNGQLAAAKVFPVLTTVSLVQAPLTNVLHAYPTITGMLACFVRIEAFLRKAERKDPRINLNLGPSTIHPGNPATYQESRIRFHHADIAKAGMKEPILRGANFQLSPGSTTTIVGRTGSGKSTIVEAILGESEVLAGSIKVDKSDVGYCSQNVWLRDTTIRKNIVGHEEYNEARFLRVIQACFLHEDLAWLPGGADYVVGTNGSNLSGGQRQRVAIARTAYKESKITLLDDVFSSLDRHTAITILHQLCGRNGIFTEAGCTVVLVTYLPDCLNVSSNLLLLSGRGKVVMTPAATRGSPFADEIAAILNDNNVSTRAATENEQQNSIRRSLRVPLPVTDSNTISRRKRDRRVYRPLLDLVGQLSAMRYALLLSVFSAGETMPEIYMRIWIELHPDDSLYFLGYVGIVLTTCMLGSVCYWILHTRLSPRSSIGFHSMLVDATIGSTLGFLGATKSGHLINLYSQDMLLISRNLPAAIFRTIYASTAAVVQLGVILSGASFLSLTLPFILVAVYFVQHYYLRTSRQIRHLDLESKSPLYTYFAETATGLSHIQALRWDEKNLEYGFHLLEESQKPYYVMSAIQQWLALVLGLLTGIVGAGLVALALFVKDGSSETSVGLSFIGLMSIARVLEVSIVSWTTIETSSGALSRLLEFGDTTPQEVTTSKQELPKQWPSSGVIAFNGVTARYRPESDDEPALDNITMTIAAGQRIGIAGRSGSGKSSLLLTLLGCIKYDGTVEIDGKNVASISRNELRSRLVTITQDQVQFQGTVRTNLLPLTMNSVKEQSVEEEEKAALKDSELEQLLKSLRIWAQLTTKGGLDAILDKVGYSKGELQLLCVARAILKQRETGGKLVLVDEATSSIDSDTEKVVNRAMKENFSGCTILTIAHRRSSLHNVEGVIDMYRGAIVGYDSLQSDEYLPDSTGSSN